MADIPFIGLIYKILNIIVVDRVGKNAEASKKMAFQKIAERQAEMEADEVRNSLCIFPEGATSNGD